MRNASATKIQERSMELPFKNEDTVLKREVERVTKERKALGLEGLVGGLECVIVNAEPDRQKAAVMEFLETTNLQYDMSFENDEAITSVLKQEGGADFLIRSRKGENPFLKVNAALKSEKLPNTRLETFVFKCPQLEKYVEIQKKRGVSFLTDDIVDTDQYRFIQTPPSAYTGNSLGFLQWTGDMEGHYRCDGDRMLALDFEKPSWPHLKHIHELDHAATRVKAEDRDKAIIEFMELTNYRFEFAIYVDFLNSITSVARLSLDDYAQVFTSGIEPFSDSETAGPTEMFIVNYGTRIHHLAFRTEEIETVYAGLGEHGMGFLVELVGSPEEGLKQTFSEPFANTMLVNEYIQRYGDFDGFFTKSNVTLLTKATEGQ